MIIGEWSWEGSGSGLGGVMDTEVLGKYIIRMGLELYNLFWIDILF